MSYDTKCHDLAEAFLANFPEHTLNDVSKLAQWIQDAIEDWIAQDQVAKGLAHP